VGPLCGKRRTVSWEGRGVRCGKPAHLRLRTDGLTFTSKYWMYISYAGVMCPVNRCNILSTDICLSLLFHWLCWDKNWVVDLWIGQLVCWGLCREPFFSGAVWSVQRCWWLAKGCHIRKLPVESVRVAYMDWRWKQICHVYRTFPYKVYIDFNHRDSRIWVTTCLW
jgi:hypothetical protein